MAPDFLNAISGAPSARLSRPEWTDEAPNMFGSPEQLPSSTPLSQTFPVHHSFSLESVGSVSRPRSSIVAPSRLSDAFSRMHGIATSSSRHTQYERPTAREWSVFGELYDREGRLRESTSYSSLRTKRSMDRDSMSQWRAQSGRTFRSPSQQRQSVAEETVQSPVDDARLFQSPAGTAVPEEDTTSEATRSLTESSTSESIASDSSHPEPQRRWPSFPKLPTLSPLARNILKCSIAYFIASLFTFSPYLSMFIADLTNYGSGESTPSPSGHMVATVAVYYNPAKTLGAMVEADLYCTMGLLFAAFVSLGSMTMFWFFEVRRGWEWLADSLVLLWIGLGMSGVAWMKLWMAKPAFNTACSMTAIILFIVVVKEGGVQTLLQVSFIVLCGAIISNTICAFLWPQRATKNLQDSMTRTLQSFSTLLQMLTETFLLEEPLHHLSGEKLQKAAESHQASFTSLKKHFVDAQSEWMFGGPKKARGNEAHDVRESAGQAYEDAIGSLNRLGQHLNGLRSGTTLQSELIKAESDGRVVLKNRSVKRRKSSRTLEGLAVDGQYKEEALPAVSKGDEEAAILQAAATMFGDLMDDLGPPLKALSTTCTTTLKRLREAVAQPSAAAPGGPVQPLEFQQLMDNIQRALYTFESTSNHAVMRLYRSHNMSDLQSRDSYSAVSDDNQLLTGGDGESVFLVYFFIFTLQEFAKELISLVNALQRLYVAEKARKARQSWWGRLTGMFTRTPWRRTRERQPTNLRNRISAYFLPESRNNNVSFPKIRPHAPNTIQTPAPADLTTVGRIKRAFWELGARLMEPDIKHAFKSGMATAILAAPAFIDSTRPWFVHYRGEWALISFFVVISPTIGATNFLALHRVLGTLLGATTAACIWTIFPENPYALSIFGFLFSIPCFYYIVSKPQYATSGRFVLLTYNLTCLYCYNLRQKDILVTEVAFHRALAVIVGVIWAAIVSRYWWPTEARRALGKALGEFCLNMGWLYTRLVAFNSFAEPEQYLSHDEDETDERMRLLRPTDNQNLMDSIHHFMAMELHLQIKLIELQGLLSQAQHEPRLKGPFPVGLYRSILTSLQTILDKLHSMRCVTSREEWHTTVRRDFILPVNKERREMVGNIILYFSTLAAAFRLKSPLPPYLPPAEEARQRLVDAIRKLDVVKNRDVRGSRQLLFFAYALTMKGVIHELDYLGHTLQDAFGVIGESREEFEALFRETATDTPEASGAV